MTSNKLTHKPIRQSNFELLRIVSMFLIVFFHCTRDIVLTGERTSVLSSSLSVNQILCFFLGSYGLAGVGVFFLLSSYFLIGQNNFSTKKLSKIVLETSFWAIVIWFVGRICHIGSSSGITSFISAFLSPFNGAYWFVTAYIFLYVVSPFLNKMIDSLDLPVYRRFIIVLTIIMPLFSTIYPDISLSDFGLAIYYYFLCGYLKKSKDNIWENNAVKIFAISTLLIFIIACSLSACCTILNVPTDGIGRLTGRWSVFQIVPAISLFYIFKNTALRPSVVINTISSASFGVYLIHGSSLKLYVWNNIFHLDYYYSTPQFFLFYIGSVILVYSIATLLDLIYKNTLEKAIYQKIHIFDNLFRKIDFYIKG